MAARKQLWHPDETRKRIQTSQLLNRLQKHALSAKPIMSDSQVRAAFGLIDKVIPNMKPTDANGSTADKLELVFKIGGA